MWIAINAYNKDVQNELEMKHLTIERDGLNYVYVRDFDELKERLADVVEELEKKYGKFEFKVFDV